MIILNVEKLLKEQKKSKEWLCNQMDISHYNLNKSIKGSAKSISYKYIEGFCRNLHCTPSELMTIKDDENINLNKNPPA